MNVPSSSERFVARPAARLRIDDHSIVWPDRGHPSLLDAAAETLLDCFDESVSIAELSADLREAVGLDEPTAHRAVTQFVTTMLASGHLAPDQHPHHHDDSMFYPPFASP